MTLALGEFDWISAVNPGGLSLHFALMAGPREVRSCRIVVDRIGSGAV
jgi:hypothetical protein